MTTLRHLLQLIRFSHTVFALPFALLAAVLAWRETPFRWEHLLGILVCMVCARSAAMAFNRLVDRRIDADNPRTAGRHLPAGLLSAGGDGLHDRVVAGLHRRDAAVPAESVADPSVRARARVSARLFLREAVHQLVSLLVVGRG